MTREPAYAAHEALVRPARARAALWRVLAGLVVVAVVSFGLGSAFRALMVVFAPGALGVVLGANPPGSTPGSLLVLLGGFGFVVIGVAVALRHLHGRGLLGVFGPPALAVRQFWRVIRALLILTLVIALLPPYGTPGGAPIPNIEPGRWLLLLPLGIAAILIQTGTEEILFRGYLQQQLAARFSSPLVWIGVPSALFAFGHYMPAEAGENAWMIAAWAGIFGILMADLTARAGTLGPAIAVHFMNNAFAILLVSLPDGLSGLALYTLPFGLDDIDQARGWLIVDFALMGLSWLAARLAIRR
jgi:membrane protease YdiL (CAAX protease family)